jgi:hypothetical protein
MARPRKNIDMAQFKKLCELSCTLTEIAGFFEVSEDTIERWCLREMKESFAECFKRHNARGKISLRRYQFKMAEHNPAMAIWLGKQYLGQTEKIEQTVAMISDETREAVAELVNAVGQRDSGKDSKDNPV